MTSSAADVPELDACNTQEDGQLNSAAVRRDFPAGPTRYRTLELLRLAPPGTSSHRRPHEYRQRIRHGIESQVFASRRVPGFPSCEREQVAASTSNPVGAPPPRPERLSATARTRAHRKQNARCPPSAVPRCGTSDRPIRTAITTSLSSPWPSATFDVGATSWCRNFRTGWSEQVQRRSSPGPAAPGVPDGPGSAPGQRSRCTQRHRTSSSTSGNVRQVCCTSRWQCDLPQ